MASNDEYQQRRTFEEDKEFINHFMSDKRYRSITGTSESEFVYNCTDKDGVNWFKLKTKNKEDEK